MRHFLLHGVLKFIRQKKGPVWGNPDAVGLKCEDDHCLMTEALPKECPPPISPPDTGTFSGFAGTYHWHVSQIVMVLQRGNETWQTLHGVDHTTTMAHAIAHEKTSHPFKQRKFPHEIWPSKIPRSDSASRIQQWLMNIFVGPTLQLSCSLVPQFLLPSLLVCPLH